ncbi:amino acid permease [Enterococcus lactis]
MLPYGLISAELGTTYDGEGGIYDQLKSLWKKVGVLESLGFTGLISSFPIWMASSAVLFQEVLTQIFQLNFSTPLLIMLQLVFVWIVTIISCYPVSDSKWILNIAAFGESGNHDMSWCFRYLSCINKRNG